MLEDSGLFVEGIIGAAEAAWKAVVDCGLLRVEVLGKLVMVVVLLMVRTRMSLRLKLPLLMIFSNSCCVKID